jgi:hypothetical protein
MIGLPVVSKPAGAGPSAAGVKTAVNPLECGRDGAVGGLAAGDRPQVLLRVDGAARFEPLREPRRDELWRLVEQWTVVVCVLRELHDALPLDGVAENGDVQLDDPVAQSASEIV